ncbi:hypothetical protein EPUS_05462 [Endocarpon pusillum Z07020]|uniref:Uncharacterized protein n=1 Tax=Endocarpon pusillum (strain Z07020 / HMAS-L-300199) TaxID=1263415 RepID=U1GCY2_ENDPU|nr:uncharacterized protein EPUS_05462 [Endocarpon pusillum Z07020]ERF69918.1 hypothetical protein EPUS_05462 [Endocarpon pusillum Z07020]
MARKRPNSSSSESEDLPLSKRARPFPIDDSDLDYEPTSTETPKVNSTYGQKGAFPGLDDGDDDELFYGPANDGIEYLRMVRSEAKGVPHILVGSNQTAQMDGANGYNDEENGDGGYYEDGAFIAAPQPTSNLPAAKSIPPDAQEAYYFSLASRFRDVRILLHQTPPLSAIESLTSDHPISLPPDSAKAQQQWRFLLQHRAPQMAQLACMEMEAVLEVVKLLKGLLASTVRTRSQEKVQRLGAWIWGVLGRCNEAGELGSEEISELRELGKRAVGLLVGIRDRSGKAYGHDEEEEDQDMPALGEETNKGDSVDLQIEPQVQVNDTGRDAHEKGPSSSTVSEAKELELAKAALHEQLSLGDQPQVNEQAATGRVDGENGDVGMEMSVEKQVRVMLDMVITIVGEVYGQRDLLEFRDIWDDEQGDISR